ncbi:protein nedd1 [Holotrichia oblita]|uniref:Protein nedd1 n=1 Tax=Holotrichia oblita TaxID=644536 RepID=A0ACB9TNX9_HOLOL|nr:protein nedd1 [Holotrichia oblita]
MVFHPSRESYLAAASKEGVVAIWDVQSNTAKFVAKNHSKYITDLAISATEELLATVGLDRKVYIYDLRSKEVVFNKMFSSELSAVACSLAGEEFAIGTTRGRIFFVDKRRPDYTKGSISAQKSSIKGICFCNDLDEENSTKLKESMSEPILTDDMSSEAQVSNDDSETKIHVTEEFVVADGKSIISRIPGGMDEQPNNAKEWVEQLPDNVGDKRLPVLQVIDESCLNAMKEEIIKCSRDIVHSFMEEINAQFLKVRMGVSREFCRIEQNNNKRWQDFNITLLKLAGCEETAKEAENEQSEVVTNESQPTLASKPESLYSPAKTKMSSYPLD